MNKADRDGVYEVIEAVIAMHVKTMHSTVAGSVENHIINCNYCGAKQIIVHPPEQPKHKVFCPICRTQMVPTRWQTDDGAFLFGWSCNCNEQSRGVPKSSGCEHEDGSGWCTLKPLRADEFCDNANPQSDGTIGCGRAL